MKSSLVGCQWLKERIGKVRVFDCTWYFPWKGNGYEKFLDERIPTSNYVDLKAVSNPETDLPHQLCSKEHFQKYFSDLGLKNDDTIVLYDQEGLYVAPRIFYMFRFYGHTGELFLLDGGLPAWKASNFDTDKKDVKPKVYQTSEYTVSGKSTINFIHDLNEVLEKLARDDFWMVDARSNDRFTGKVPEPRNYVKSGHMMGKNVVNVFFKSIWDDRKLMKKEELRKRFGDLGVPLDNKTEICLCCGSGVTCCVLALALEDIGVKNFKIFDGSWTEYATQEGAKIVKGD